MEKEAPTFHSDLTPNWVCTMSGTVIGPDQVEEAMFAHEVYDEALEAMAGTSNDMAGRYTLFYCTALDLCPGP